MILPQCGFEACCSDGHELMLIIGTKVGWNRRKRPMEIWTRLIVVELVIWSGGETPVQTHAFIYIQDLGGYKSEGSKEGDSLLPSQNVASAIHDMNIVIDDFVDLVVNVSLTQSNETIRDATLAMEAKVIRNMYVSFASKSLQKFYKDMLLTEDRYLGSAWHKAEDLTLNVQWTFWSALFYSFTVFSTVGYGESCICNQRMQAIDQ